MTNLGFEELDSFFRNDNFPAIEDDIRGIRFLKLRSMSRKDIFEEFCNLNSISLDSVSPRNYFSYIFEQDRVTDERINNFIDSKYHEERAERLGNQEYLVDQLGRLQFFDWGGSFGNSLEKNIVNNYVKKYNLTMR